MADCPIDIPAGTRVLVEMRNVGEIAAAIVWATDGRIGAAFERPIDPKAARKPLGKGGRDGIVPPLSPQARRRPGLRIG